MPLFSCLPPPPTLAQKSPHRTPGQRPARPGAGALSALAFFGLIASAFAGNHADSQPRSAAEELKAFEVANGLQVELVAAEPLVQSPCAMAFDEHGRLFVAENRGYPIGPAEGQPPVGTIAMLEDTDGDGRMDKRTVFADGLTFPNGVMPWKGGLIVTCAPDVLFLEDTDGDGRADQRTVLLTGFDITKSTQLRVNKPTLGPDGWIYFAAGLAGGEITSPAHPERPALKMTGDLRWNPRTGEYQNVDGRSQYGLSFDDWGNRFICMNRIQVQHVVLSSKDLQRNPNLAFSDTVQNCPELIPNLLMHSTGGAARIYPISSNITTADSHIGTFSAACAIMIWRGGALPEQYRGCALTCEPTGNLVHVDKLEPKGVTFAAVPLLDKEELLASRDDWTRPVYLESGPDGALYVCDMYRRVIEHPDYLPPEIRKHTNFEGGKELGRIWRVSAAGARLKLLTKPDATTEQLVAMVAKGSGWRSQTAFRQLMENELGGSVAEREFTTTILRAVVKARSTLAPSASRAMIWDLLALQEPQRELMSPPPLEAFREALLDSDPGVQALFFRMARERTIHVTMPLAPTAPAWATFQRALALPVYDPKLAKELPGFPPPFPRVSPTLGEEERAKEVAWCAAVLGQTHGDRWQEAAILSACARQTLELVLALRQQPGFQPTPEFYGLAGQVLGRERANTYVDGLITALTPYGNEIFAVVAGFCGSRKKEATTALEMKTPASAALLKSAIRDITDPAAKALDSAKVAILTYAEWDAARAPLFAAALKRDQPKVFEVAVRALASFDAPEVASTLLQRDRWQSATPAERESLLAPLLARPQHLAGILDAIERKDIPTSAIASVKRAAFEKSQDPVVRERAAKLFAEATGDRQKVFEAAKECLTLTPDAAHGHQLFTQTCTTCHRLNQEGSAVGPDLFDIRNQPKESILFHIIIPDAEIAPNFTAYLAETKDGRTLAGLLASETATSVTLRMPLAQEETILRANLAKLTALPNSLMPTGLETAWSKQDLADLLAYLKGEG